MLRGDDVVLGPRAVLTLAMAFHELTTNAAKYGALASPGGRIEIGWHRIAAAGEAAGRNCGSTGSRQAGRRSSSPTRRGFGSRMIEGSIAAELGGSARMMFDAGGPALRNRRSAGSGGLGRDGGGRVIQRVGEVRTEGWWWSQAGSNRRPRHCERRALPAELWPLPNPRQRLGCLRFQASGRHLGPGVWPVKDRPAAGSMR